ncbi:MAG: type II toxin-antitoxin system Phd/YefM family antitoxin [Elusimicrobiota bacterium]
MSVSIIEDIKSVSDLKKNTRHIFEQLHRTNRPIVVTVNGKPDVVILDAATFENKLKTLNLGVLLAEAEDEVKKGHLRSARKFIREFRQNAKISG